MAQAGLHGIVGLAARRWAPRQEWLVLGIVLGTMLPDADNIAVAIATLAGRSTEGLHRTFTHSLFTVAATLVVFALVARVTGRARWRHLGVGLGVGVLTHIAFDLLIWFNGVALLWPLPLWVDLWVNVSPPAWWSQLMMPAEFLAFAAFFGYLGAKARDRGTDAGFQRRVGQWTAVQLALFVIFTLLLYTFERGFMIPYGAVYLFSLGLALVITVRMRDTVEAV